MNNGFTERPEHLAGDPERREAPRSYDLLISLTRHGPKQGDAGPLTQEGAEYTSDRAQSDYKGVVTNVTEIVHSGKDRARQTAEQYAIPTGNSQTSFREDARLSEGNVAEYPGFREHFGGDRSRWAKGWFEATERSQPDAKTGGEALADLSSWILEKIKDAKETGGVREIDAFTHGPLQAVLLLGIQERVGGDLLPADWIDRDIFTSMLKPLSTLTLHVDSNRPDEIIVRFRDRRQAVPVSFFEGYAVTQATTHNTDTHSLTFLERRQGNGEKGVSS